MSLYEEVKKEMEAEEQQRFLDHKKFLMRMHINETMRAAKTLSLSDERAKEIENMTFEDYQKQLGGVPSDLCAKASY